MPQPKRPGHAPGRQSKLTPERQERIVALIAAGNYGVTACRAAGIAYQTYLNWLERGRQETEGPYVNFLAAITRAEADAEQRLVEQIAAAVPTDWRAGAHLLERRYPDRWGRKERVEHSGRMEMSHEHGVRVDQANALLAALGYDPLGPAEPGDAGSRSGVDSTPEADPRGE